MIYTNINITNSNHTFNYMVGYESIDEISTNQLKYNISYTPNSNINNICIFDDKINLIKQGNVWVKEDNINKIDNYLPEFYKIAKIALYFPQYSVDVYSPTKYAFNINTWINGFNINLGCYEISRIDSMACPHIRKYANDYHEYVEFNIIDPWQLTYGDNWDEFRKKICGEKHLTNTTGSILNFSLYPIIEGDDNKYIMLDNYQGGVNSINISHDTSDYLQLNISPNITPVIDNSESMDKYIDWKPSILCKLMFNSEYTSLQDYLIETYNIKSDQTYIKYELVIKDKDNIYSTISSEKINNNIYKFYQIGVNDPSQSNLIDWSWWKIYHENNEDNLIIQCIGSIITGDEEKIYIRSNEIPLTQELFSYFVDNENINYVNIKYIDMNLYNINAINKTINKIYHLDNQNDAKSNIIQPVFFKARDVSNIIIHPAVTENICINLDAFKSKVKTFMIQIEGVTFTEIGRVASGVIFKINGKNLLNEIKEGVYYILNEDGELVTNGKYKYEA